MRAAFSESYDMSKYFAQTLLFHSALTIFRARLSAKNFFAIASAFSGIAAGMTFPSPGLTQAASSPAPETAIPETAIPEATTPATEANPPSEAAYLNQFFDYIYSQKHTLLLGEDRASCAYFVDPTDIHTQGNTRLTTAVVTRGRGTACGGVLNFQVLQAECEGNVLYAFGRVPEGDIRFRGWNRFELPLYRQETAQSTLGLENQSETTQRSAAETLCALPSTEP